MQPRWFRRLLPLHPARHERSAGAALRREAWLGADGTRFYASTSNAGGYRCCNTWADGVNATVLNEPTNRA
ncbi:hypothetical protein OH492_00940 [Vibrio chagasii]|nr:hypothetical protein [Vibrio chagasii]